MWTLAAGLKKAAREASATAQDAILLQASSVSGEPIPVRYSEGTTHGFLAFRTLEGKLLASGEVTEVAFSTRTASNRPLFRQIKSEGIHWVRLLMRNSNRPTLWPIQGSLVAS